MPVVTDYTALLGGNYWNGIEVAGRPVIVTYSFPTAAPAYDADVSGFTAATVASFQAFTPAQQTQARAALAEWAAASGIVFIEVAPGQGDINFQSVDFDTTPYAGAGGIAFEPFGAWDGFSYPQFRDDLDASGDVFMNSLFVTGGLFSYGTLLHEIGHALGLKHPTETRTNFAADPDIDHDQVLSADDPFLTIMATVGGAPETLKQLDKDAVAFLYGASGGGVYTANASGANSVVSSWSWNAATQVLTQAGFAGDDTIRGSSVVDVVSGLAGDDRLFGLAGNDTLDGGAGNDELFGGGGADDMTGGANDDIYYVDNSGDAIHETAGGGYDSVVSFVSHALAGEVEQLQLLGDALTGTGNGLANVIYGDGFFGNTVNGLSGDDYVVTGGGADTIDGGAGNDTMWAGGGADTASYASAGGGVVVSLAAQGAAQATGGAGDDVLNEFENLTGSAFNDVLTGDGGANVLSGLAGNDVLEGGAGNDILNGGADIDTASYAGAAGAVFVDLRSSGQQNTGGAGSDTLSGMENLTGSSFNDTLYGGYGDNVIDGGGSNDYILAFSGNDTIHGGAGADIAYGGDGDDVLNGDANDDTLLGDNGNDTLNGGDGIDRLYGGANNDALNGEAGNDIFYGGAGNDALDGGTGADNMRGETGDDIYFLDNAGDIAIEALNEGADEVRSTSAVQFLGANVETLTGLSASGQRLGGNTLANLITGAGGNDVITGDAGNDVIHAGGGNDYIYGDANNDTLHGDAGNDVFYGGDGDDQIFGGAGADIIDSGTGTNDLRGGADNDTYYLRGVADDVIEAGGEGNDTVYVFASAFTLDSGSEVETIFARLSTATTLTGNELGQRIVGEAGDDGIDGGGGGDLLEGRGGADGIFGGAGNDTIYGGAGNDTLRGGLGIDAIDLGAGNDNLVCFVADFAPGIYDNVYGFSEVAGSDFDTLQLQGSAANYTFLDGAGFVRVIHTASGGSAYIYGMTAASIADQVTYFA